MNPSIIWGTVLILVGLSLILKSIFHISIPLVRPLFGCMLIYLGLSIMMDPFNKAPDKVSTIFGRSKTVAHERIKTYNAVFASNSIDLSQLDPQEPMHITINTVFGATHVALNPAIPTKMTVQAICSRAELPDETLVSFGRNTYRTDTSQEPRLFIHVNSVFANFEAITEEKAQTAL